MTTMHIKGVGNADELEIANDLMAKTHFTDYHEGLRWLHNFDANYPEYQREHTRTLWIEGRLAAALRLVTHTVRLGEARLKMGGFAAVTTDGIHRKKGYMARLMDDSMRYLKAQGYHVSILFGITEFYHRWGFASVLPEYASVIDLREADVVASGLSRHRLIKPGDVNAVQRIHNQNDADTACSVIRVSAHISNRWERWKNARVVTDENGKVVAYYIGCPKGDAYVVDEVGVAGYGWCHALLQACTAQAKPEFAGRIRFTAPPSHPFIRHLLQYRSYHEMHVSRNSDGMMAVVSISETLECMIPEWESLLAQSAAASLCAEFTLVVDRQPWRVRAHRGAVDIAAVSGQNKVSLSSLELIQLLSGHRHLEEVLALKRRALNVPGSTLLQTMFPKRTPYVWAIDRF